MKKPGRSKVRFGIIVMALGLAIALMLFTFWYYGSNGGRFVRAKVILYDLRQMDGPTLVKEITEPEQIRRLASFFPGLGRRRSIMSAGYKTGVIVSFVEADGGIVEVLIDSGCEVWAWGSAERSSNSCFRVRGDLAGFIEELFPEAPTDE